jgi:branched-chain amino acid transport system substrate-binding protein
VHSLGLKNTEGLQFTTSWYWDLNDATRKWSARYYEKTKKQPGETQAADYSATMAYLNAIKAAGTTDADKVMEKLKSTKLDDFFASGYIRADGRYVHDMYSMQVKAPGESKKEWDYYKVVKKLPGEEVFTTKSESKCGLWK